MALMILFSCSSAGTRSPLPGTRARSRRSRSTPGATGRSRRRCGTCSGRRAASRWRRCSGARCDAVPAYASWGSLRDRRCAGRGCGRAGRAGFGAVKIRIARERIDEGVAVVEAVRSAVGDRLEIIVDLNQWWRMAGDIERGLGPADARASDRAARGLTTCSGWRSRCPARIARGCACCASRPACGSAAARWRGRSTSCCARSRTMPSTCSSPTSCLPSACPARARWPSSRCGATGGSRRTPGPTGSGCWPTCTCVPEWAVGRTSSSPTTRRGGRRSGATSCWPSR